MNAKKLFYSSEKEFSKAESRSYCREELVYNVTEDLLVAMEDIGISKKELASKLNKSRSYVSQILNGSRNMTLGTLSDICFALNAKPSISILLDTCEKPARIEDHRYHTPMAGVRVAAWELIDHQGLNNFASRESRQEHQFKASNENNWKNEDKVSVAQ